MLERGAESAALPRIVLERFLAQFVLAHSALPVFVLPRLFLPGLFFPGLSLARLFPACLHIARRSWSKGSGDVTSTCCLREIPFTTLFSPAAILHKYIAAYARHGRQGSARDSSSRGLVTPEARSSPRSLDGNASGSPRARIAMYCAVHAPIPGTSQSGAKIPQSSRRLRI